MTPSFIQRGWKVTETSRDGRYRSFLGLVTRFDSRLWDVGHIRLFPFLATMAGSSITGTRWLPGWSKSRVWYFGLISIIHIDAGPNEELKHCHAPGWHVRFAKLKIERIYGGFAVSFRLADKGVRFLRVTPNALHTHYHWHPWFAWRPVIIDGPSENQRTLIWLEKIQRRLIITQKFNSSGEAICEWEYMV